MKINEYFWYSVLTNIKYKVDNDKFNPEWSAIIIASKVKEILPFAKEPPYFDTVEDIAKILGEVDLKENSKLEHLFFKEWKANDYRSKQTLYQKGHTLDKTDENYFVGDFKEYFIKKLIEYPTVNDIYVLRHNFSQQDLNVALKNILRDAFNSINSFQMEDKEGSDKKNYWENYIKGNQPNRLLDLLEMASFEKKELIEWDNIGFLHKTKQSRFNRLIGKTTNKSIETSSSEVYLVKINVNAFGLMPSDYIISQTKLNSIDLFINIMFEEAIKSQSSCEYLHNGLNGELKFLIHNKSDYESAEKVKKAVIDWISDNVNIILKKIESADFSFDMRVEAKVLLNSIILENKLNDKLEEKNNSKLKAHKI